MKIGYEQSRKFVDFIKSNIPEAKIVSGGREILCRCRYCPDSRDHSHAHMYIHIPQDKGDISTFNCFKCHMSGIVTSRTLSEWGLYDPMVGDILDNIYKYASNHNYTKGYNIQRYKFNNFTYNTQLATIKLNYLNSRLGLNLNIQDCIENKIILNLKDGLNATYINKYTRDPNIINQLNDNFIGFLSMDNNYVNLRRICDKGKVYSSIDKRYINYNIHDKRDNTEKYYVLPCNIDLNNPYPIDIHIAEGPMDILSIYHNLRNKTPGIYGSINGSGYMGMIMHLICDLKIFYFNLHIYPDNDESGSNDIIYDISNKLSIFYGSNIYIHRNVYHGEKDFGVPLNRINESIIYLSKY